MFFLHPRHLVANTILNKKKLFYHVSEHTSAIFFLRKLKIILRQKEEGNFRRQPVLMITKAAGKLFL